jgi:hypothetical protein
MESKRMERQVKRIVNQFEKAFQKVELVEQLASRLIPQKPNNENSPPELKDEELMDVDQLDKSANETFLVEDEQRLNNEKLMNSTYILTG